MVENSEYVKFARRIMRALATRAGADVDTLPELRAIQEDLEMMMQQSVAACRAEGYSWGEIAQRLGTTRQGAQQRYGKTTGRPAEQRQPAVDVPIPFDGEAE